VVVEKRFNLKRGRFEEENQESIGLFPFEKGGLKIRIPGGIKPLKLGGIVW
jgi:hypothetical protein